jgi:hypothetical protein
MTYPLITPFERVNGSNTKAGTLYTQNCSLYNIYVINSSDSAVDLTAQDSYGGDAKVDGVIEAIVKELNPLAYFTSTSGSKNIISVVLDVRFDEGIISPTAVAAELTKVIQRLSPVNTYGSDTPTSVNIAHSVVWPATSMTFGDSKP